MKKLIIAAIFAASLTSCNVLQNCAVTPNYQIDTDNAQICLQCKGLGNHLIKQIKRNAIKKSF